MAVTYPSLVNVREGPGDEYAVLINVGQGTRIRIHGIDPDEDWYLVEVDGLDKLGWVFENLTVLVGTLDGVKRVTADEIAMLPVAIANTALLNVRSGPSTSYGVATTLASGTWAKIIGMDSQAEWFQIELTGGTGQSWISRDLSYLVGSLSGVTPAVVSGGDPPTAPASSQPTAGSITIELSLPADGRINLDVSWTDASACAQVYNLYYRSSDQSSSTYFSLETAVTASTASSKSLSFLTLPAGSLISAWCGTNGSGRQVAEVQIDPNAAGTYSSAPSSPDATAGGPSATPQN